MRRLAPALSWQGHAEEIKTTENPADKMVLSIWRVPPGFIAKPEELPVIFRSKEEPRAARFDAKEFFEKSGVPFPPGAFVIYNAQSHKILVRNTRHNLNLVEFILGGHGYFRFGMPMCEIQAFECDLGALARRNINPPPTYADLKRLPPSAIKLIDQASAISKSGLETEMRSDRSAPPPGGQAPASPELREQLERQKRFADEESGTLATIETVVGRDGLTCDTNLSCRMKIPSDKGGFVEFQFRNDFVTLGDQPAVIYSAPFPGPGRKTLVVVAKMLTVDFDGMIFNPQAPGPEYSR